MKREHQLLLAIVAVGAVVRLALFTGLTVGDDTFYQLQAITHALAGQWPPEPYHWHTRLGMTLPTAAILRIAGLQSWAFLVLPFLASVSGMVVTYRIARDFVDTRPALLAAAFHAAYPFEIIYATHLFPDIPVGLLATISLWLWIRGLRSNRAADFALAGLSFAAGYLFRETIILAAPAYVGLWVLYGRWRRPAVLATAVAPCLLVALEMAVYHITTGRFDYRIAAVVTQQHDPLNLDLVSRSAAGGGYWTDPLLMLLTNQEFGAYQFALLIVLIPAWYRFPNLRPLVVWWGALFIWTFYGPTTLHSFVILQRDPRYAAALTVPTVVILAQAIVSLTPTLRIGAAGALVATGILSALLDQGAAIIEPHLAFARSSMAREATMEPVEYYGARWQVGLQNPASFRCAMDVGRPAVVKLLAHLPHAVCVPSGEARYFVVSAERRPDLTARLVKTGWTHVASFAAPAPFGRRVLASMLAPWPGQRERSRRIRSTPALQVWENAAFR